MPVLLKGAEEYLSMQKEDSGVKKDRLMNKTKLPLNHCKSINLIKNKLLTNHYKKCYLVNLPYSKEPNNNLKYLMDVIEGYGVCKDYLNDDDLTFINTIRDKDLEKERVFFIPGLDWSEFPKLMEKALSLIEKLFDLESLEETKKEEEVMTNILTDNQKSHLRFLRNKNANGGRHYKESCPDKEPYSKEADQDVNYISNILNTLPDLKPDEKSFVQGLIRSTSDLKVPRCMYIPGWKYSGFWVDINKLWDMVDKYLDIEETEGETEPVKAETPLQEKSDPKVVVYATYYNNPSKYKYSVYVNGLLTVEDDEIVYNIPKKLKEIIAPFIEYHFIEGKVLEDLTETPKYLSQLEDHLRNIQKNVLSSEIVYLQNKLKELEKQLGSM